MYYKKTQNRIQKSSRAVLAIPWILTAGLWLSGCGDKNDTTNVSNTDSKTITAKAKASFTGKVMDVNGEPISGAGVSLFANKKYTATADSNGNFLIEVDLGDVTAAPGGGSGVTSPADPIGPGGGIVERDFPMEISKSGFTTFHHTVHFEGVIGYTDGSGAVVLLSQVGSVLPLTVLVPFVDSFSFTVYAGDSPAAGAVVTLVGSENAYGYFPSNNTDNDTRDYFETGVKTFVANSSGVVTISETDKVPANGSYSAFVAPYDAGGDGQYEYNSTYASSIFNLDADLSDTTSMIHDVDGSNTWVQSENAPTINLRDASSDISVVYLSIANVQNIPIAQAAGFNITVMFNRPVLQETLANMQGPLFELTSHNGNMPVPFTVTNTGEYMYTITPDITLDPSRNSYEFSVNDALSYSGDVDTDPTTYGPVAQTFVIYDPNATFSSAITPGLDIDENTTYKVDWDRFLVGDMTTTSPLVEDTSQGPSINDDLRLSFLADSTATGYQIWVKDSDSPWINVEDAGVSLSYTYNDGQALEVTVNNVFAPSFAGGEFLVPLVTNDFQEPFLDSNQLQFVVMPENINGFATDPNSDSTIVGLTLGDNWGPEVMDTGNPNFDGTATTEFGPATFCDDVGVNIAVGEPLLSQTLTAEFAAGEFGAKAVTGSACFTVSGVRFPDLDLADPTTTPYPSNFSYIEVDLDPSVATTSSADATTGDDFISVASNAGFAYGDNVRVGTMTNEQLHGFIGTTGIVVDSLDTDEVSGSDVYWRGPLQNGYDDVSNTLSVNTITNAVFLLLDDVTDIDTGNGAVLTSARRVTAKNNDFSVMGGGIVTQTPFITIDTELSAAVAPGSTISGFNLNQVGACNTDLAAAAAIGDTTITVTDATGCAVSDTIVIGFTPAGSDVEIRTISAIAANVLTVSALTNAHAIGESADEGVAWSATTVFGYPRIYLANTTGIMPGAALTFTNAAGTETDTVNVVSMEGDWVDVDDIPVDGSSTAFAYVAGDSWSVDSSRGPDALEVQVQDRSGNDSDDTDTDGDGAANFDQIGYEEVDGAWDVF